MFTVSDTITDSIGRFQFPECLNKLLGIQDRFRQIKPIFPESKGQFRNLRNRKTAGLQFLLPPEDLMRGSVHNNLTAVHHDHTIRIHHFFHVVGNEDHGDPFAVIQLM